ncbi:HNH endonuclease [Clostridium sp. D2Q-11]|uniref:HNH endonuclease n=1 Tax=Anaeromonas frigoriresistens TaxID=2683708 RepID=A0A942Z8C4_9FIRM|nr:HNH endonuclease [Anaeromonas frigoriresistens]MBS4539647.1 HNH endonuclease [Anaeromonas frigoriresistens]
MREKTCSKCGSTLPLNKTYYQKRKDSKDGFRGTCRKCQGYNYLIPNPVKEGFKKCSKCKRELPESKEYFNADKNRPDGLTTQCKECRYKKEIFNVKKEVIPEEHKKCIDCKKILHISNFKTNKNSKDGYYMACTSCLIKRRRIGCKEGHKICRKCKRELPSTNKFFLISKTSFDGLENTCLECAGRKFNPKKKYTLWSDGEIDILIESYLILTKEELQKLLPSRTWKAIRSRANKMNLKRTNDYKNIPDDELYKSIDNIKHKKCKKCREYYPFDAIHFPKDIACNDGYRNICKECKGENFAISDAQQWSLEEEEVFIELYSSKTNTELIKEHFPNRTLKNLQDKAYTIWIQKGIKLYKNIETTERMIRQKSTQEWKDKISETLRKRGIFKGEKNPMYGVRRTGSLNPNWKNGRTPEKQIIMNTPKYKGWRNKVMQRDNYSCQICGNKKSGNLEVHHLDNFADFIEKRFIIDNGITLCKECHNPNKSGSYHNVFGTVGNTREEFLEYIVEVRNLNIPSILNINTNIN